MRAAGLGACIQPQHLRRIKSPNCQWCRKSVDGARLPTASNTRGPSSPRQLGSAVCLAEQRQGCLSEPMLHPRQLMRERDYTVSSHGTPPPTRIILGCRSACSNPSYYVRSHVTAPLLWQRRGTPQLSRLWELSRALPEPTQRQGLAQQLAATPAYIVCTYVSKCRQANSGTCPDSVGVAAGSPRSQRYQAKHQHPLPHDRNLAFGLSPRCPRNSPPRPSHGTEKAISSGSDRDNQIETGSQQRAEPRQPQLQTSLHQHHQQQTSIICRSHNHDCTTLA